MFPFPFLKWFLWLARVLKHNSFLCLFVTHFGFCNSGWDLGLLSLFFLSPLLGALFNGAWQGFIIRKKMISMIPRISKDAPHSSHLDHEAESCLDFIRIRYILGILFRRSRRRFVDQSEFETWNKGATDIGFWWCGKRIHSIMPARLSKSWNAGLPFGCNLGLFAGVLSVESDNNVGFLALYKSLSCRSHSIHSMTTTSANKWGNISSHGVHGIWSTRSHWSQNGNGQVFFGALLNFQYPTWVWRGMSTKIDYCTEIFRPLMVQKVLYCRSPPWLLTLQTNEAISVVIQCMECDLPVIIDLKMDMSKGSLRLILNFRTDIWCHMWSIWRGVAKLHSYGFLPRDLNASSILLEGNLSGKTKDEDHKASGILILLQSGGCTYFKTWWAFYLCELPVGKRCSVWSTSVLFLYFRWTWSVKLNSQLGGCVFPSGWSYAGVPICSTPDYSSIFVGNLCYEGLKP